MLKGLGHGGYKMNRIAKFFENDFIETNRSPVEKPDSAPTECGFCGKNLKGNLFTGWTRADVDPTQAICLDCVDRFATQTQFTRNFSIYWEFKPNYKPLQQKLLRRIAGEGGSPALKYTLVEIAIQLLKRQSAKMASVVEEICPKTGVNLLGYPRLAVIGNDVEYCAAILPVIFKEIGLIYRPVTQQDLASGKGFNLLMENEAKGEAIWAEYSIMYSAGYATPNTRSIVIYSGHQASEFPADIEKIFVNESVKQGKK
jgi:hypothetical protein